MKVSGIANCEPSFPRRARRPCGNSHFSRHSRSNGVPACAGTTWVGFLRGIHLRWRAQLAALLLALLPVLAGAAPAALVLDDQHGQVDAWPALTLLSDPHGRLSAGAALAAADSFAPPRSAYATLGVHKDVVWLKIPVKLAANSDGQWVLHIDYAVLNRVDVFVGTPGQVARRAVLGNLQARRKPAVLLRLAPGQEHLILLRVENIGSMILPVRLSKPGQFHAGELNEQMLQGMLIGLSLCLLLYSLAQWINLREPLFGKFALLIAGTTLFSVEFFGLGTLYLWTDNDWMTLHAGGLFSLMASCGAYLFVEQALARPGMDRTFSRLMKTGAALTVATALAFAYDAIGVETLVAIVSTLGLLPMLLGLPGAYMRARRGDAVGIYFLVGWAVSFLSAVVLSQVISGNLPAKFWTMHALQFGNVFDMLVFMRILGLRTKAMQSAMLRAEAATRMKSDFLASMSHEIRTPLNAIIGMSRLALAAEPDPKLRNYVGKIQGAGEHLLGIINDILDFSKIEAGRLALESVPFDLDEMLEHLASLTVTKADAKQVELVFRVARGVPARLVGDPMRLSQILINLTSNAVKFTDKGEIVVAVEVAERSADGVTLRFTVSDTGIGMDPVQMARLFQPFGQADGSITRKYGGTGLGLSISKQLVELMKGSIDVSSTPGVGSRFSVTVRLGIGDPAAGKVAPPAAVLQQVRALVVDDCASARDALVEMLGSFGVTAHSASSGEQSLTMLARAIQTGEPYQVVLMDYMMPGWDGVETIRRIRADQRYLVAPSILMVSSSTREAVRQQEGLAPWSAFLTKPVGPALLYHSLLQVLQPADSAPDAGAPPPLEPGAGARDLSRLDGARILLVDDNANNREVALDFMAAARMRIDTATDGAEAVRMVQQGDYDLVLMDIQMREVDGLSAARQIRAIEGCRHLPIIAMTAYAMAEDRASSLAAGMNDHIAKPFDPDLLFRALLKWIDPARLAGRTSAAGAAPARPAAPIAPDLPRIRGLDWEQALASVDRQHSRLHKRVRNFLQEYRSAPPALRAALASANYGALQGMAHNLKSNAAYLGAHELAAHASVLEQELRAGQMAQVEAHANALVATLDVVLSGLAQVDAEPVAGGYDAAGAGRQVRRLETFLRGDNALAEDALLELKTVLASAGHGHALAALQRAVDDVEYPAALAVLAELAQALDMKLEESA
jgi:two-component system sensor histidine kinase/response regulator